MEGQGKGAAVPRDRDDETGQFRTTYTPEKALAAIEEYDGAASTAEVQETLGCSRRLALDLLHELEDEGRVSTREISNTYLWMIQEDSDQ